KTNNAIRPTRVHLNPKFWNSGPGCKYAAPTQTKQIYRSSKKTRVLIVTGRPLPLRQLTAQLFGSPNQIHFENQETENCEGDGHEHYQTKLIGPLTGRRFRSRRIFRQQPRW